MKIKLYDGLYFVRFDVSIYDDIKKELSRLKLSTGVLIDRHEEHHAEFSITMSDNVTVYLKERDFILFETEINDENDVKSVKILPESIFKRLYGNLYTMKIAAEVDSMISNIVSEMRKKYDNNKR